MKKNLSAADLVVLSLLTEEPMHGYRIVSELERRDAKDWITISRPQVYYTLKKLLDLKFVAPIASNGDSAGPERDTFRATSAGKKVMNQTLSDHSWAEHRPPPPFLTWIALSSHLSAAETRKVIASRRLFLLKEIQREQKTLSDFSEETDKMAIAGRLMVSLTVEQFEVELKWLERVMQELPKARE